jgi:hypothetical protein
MRLSRLCGLHTLSANLLFPGKYALNIDALNKEAFYNKVRKEPYATDGYLNGL